MRILYPLFLTTLGGSTLSGTMTPEADAGRERPRGLRALVYEALPEGASPTDTACQPIPRHILERAQGDIVELTRQKLSEHFGSEKHVVITIRDGDLDPSTDGDVLAVLEQTDGGVLAFGVSYTEAPAAHEATAPTAAPAVDPNESCPECGSHDAFEVTRGAPPGPDGKIPVLLECRECGAVWDSFAPA